MEIAVTELALSFESASARYLHIMDVKALAKSKRAHSQHHSKRPHNQNLNLKPPSSSSASNDAVGTAKKPLGKQVKEKTHRSQSQGSSGSRLPSNWDRYGEEFESGSEGVSVSPSDADVVVPRSKGADFRHLLSEAHSQSQAITTLAFDFDDVLPGEFNMGLGSMLAVRGEGILSWIGDDNFVMEDKTSATHEPSFLSLNLHALAENLEKVELSKRLFIESDLLPTELCVEGSAVGSSEQPDKLHPTEDSELANRMSEELILDDFFVDFKTADHFTSSSCGSSHAESAFTSSNNFLIPVNNVDVEFTQVGSSDLNKAFDRSVEANIHSIEDTKREHLTFDAATAEEELDMLLDSFGETKNLDSPGLRSNRSPPVSLGVTSVDPQISTKEPVSSKTASITASLDDALDNLLEETSTLMNPNVLLRPQEQKSVIHNMQSVTQSGSVSKVSDDFDSWLDTI